MSAGQLSLAGSRATAVPATIPGWDLLRHGGLLLDPPRLRRITEYVPAPLDEYTERELRRRFSALTDGGASSSDVIAYVLEHACGFTRREGAQWLRGPAVPAEYGCRAVTGESIKPRHLWLAENGAMLPVFIDDEKRIGVGRGRRATSHVVQWLRGSGHRLALLTNGRQWRLIFAGLDFDAFAEADADLFFEEGGPAPQLEALRTLLQPALWTPPAPDALAPLEQAILDSRKGQAELSSVLGERVREAVEVLVQAHGELLAEQAADIPPADIYRAAVRVIMRLVVVLFAESRELLPRENALYHGSYGLGGLIEQLSKHAHRSGGHLARSHAAWPRVLSLFRLVYQGSSHPALPVPAYGGELFAPGDPQSAEGLSRALALFETGWRDRQLMPDRDVHRILELITRTKVKIRQGRASTWVPSPVDFSDLSSEYIGILYEGLLDYELKQAEGDPVVFLAVGNAPALSLSRLEVMDDRAIRELLEKMKDNGTAEAEEGPAEADEAAEDDDHGDHDEDAADEVGDGEVADDSDADRDEDQEDDHDARHTTLLRAEQWARRAVLAAGLVRAPRGTLTPEKRLAHESQVAAKARQLLDKRGVVLPGEWYVVRWGGTRKGAGTFYTRPGLAVPTVQRTLRPLAYDPPTHADGTPNTDAPPAAWKPKKPEEILALKVVDPACGSGTFPVAALRFLTEALYESLLFHDRISNDTARERAVVRLIEPPEGAPVPEERLAQELVPCRTADAEFEPRLKALLRRHVVERCIYGVDLDPLAVELARLSLWIETMDRSLPFSFLDHKIKCGNALVGAWFDTFRHYPVMAFKNREGGDKGHSNGVHFAKDARTKALKMFASGPLKSDLARFLSGPTLFDERDVAAEAQTVHDEALALLARLHELPVHDTAERARIYREELVGSPAYRQLKEAMDLWCACWFWPADELEAAPLPATLHDPAEETRAIGRRMAAEKRFFHWELEFPDVFRESGSGFDAALGNPPWETLQPNSKEYFSNIDPLYRSYGKQEALRKQTEYFADEAVERAWLDYTAGFACDSNWMKYAANPFGDPDGAEASVDRFSISRGRENDALHARWRELRRASRGYADAAHPFRHRGEGKAYTYKLFLETAHALLRRGGRLGFIVPSGLYSDHGTGALRELFLDRCRWEWLFGFENKEGIFDIHRSFKFNPVIIEKGGRTEAIRTAFMRRSLEDWERAEELAVPYTREQVERFSPVTRILVDVLSEEHRQALIQLHSNSNPLASVDGRSPLTVQRTWQGDINLTSEVHRAWHRDQLEGMGVTGLDGFGRALVDGEPAALPIYQGAMIHQLNPLYGRYVDGRGHNTRWAPAGFEPGGAQFWLPCSDFTPHQTGRSRLLSRRLVNAANERTMIAAVVPDFPSSDTTLVWVTRDNSLIGQLLMATCISSLAFDWVARARVAGATGATALDLDRMQELPVPRGLHRLAGLTRVAAELNLCGWLFAPQWLTLHAAGIVERPVFALLDTERLRLRCIADALVAAAYGLTGDTLKLICADCDHPVTDSTNIQFTRLLDQRGFWRVDKDKDPELRHTVLTLVGFHDLEEKIRACGDDRDAGIEAFLGQNEGEGWMLPETLRLADYGLGHDERAKHPQPVASRLGPRFYDWQLAQSAEESWRECHLHARNLLGEQGYRELLDEVAARERGEESGRPEAPPASLLDEDGQGALW